MDQKREKIEETFWFCYARGISEKIQELTACFCYGCNHNKPQPWHHGFCRKTFKERTRCLIDSADALLPKEKVKKEWKEMLNHDLEPYDDTWADIQFGSHSRLKKVEALLDSDKIDLANIAAIDDDSDEECLRALELGSDESVQNDDCSHSCKTYELPQQKGGQLSASDAYELVKTSTVRVPKFNTEATDYQLKVKDFKIGGLRQVLPILRSLFESILQTTTKDMAEHDQIRFVMNSPSQLDHPISLPFMQARQLTPMRILAEVERVLQSHEEFSLDGTVEINIIHVEMPIGSGKTYGSINLKARLQKKKCIIQIRNNDELCMARAIVTAKARLDQHPKYRDFKDGRKIQSVEAVKLHQKAQVGLNSCGLEELKKFQAVLEYQLVLVSAEHFNAIIFKGPAADKQIYLYLHDGHYSVITSMPAFLNRSYFCLSCNKGYNTEDAQHHKCNNKCCCCFKDTCPGATDWIYCQECQRNFKGQQCFANHKEGVKPVCTIYKKCPKCGKVVNCLARPFEQHKCGEVKCNICNAYVQAENHKCYMQPLDRSDGEPKSKKKKEDQQDYLFFDFECMQETGVHVPNLVVVQDDKGDEHVFRGPNTRDEFCDWLFSGECDGYVCIAHNLKGYDAYFILQYLYKNKILPDLILNGAKVMEIYVPHANIKFIDSLNFIGMPLAMFPKSFGLTELAKGYFPHFFNTQANQKYVGPIPDKKYYDPDGMKAVDREKFLTWYEEQKRKNVVFDFEKEILTYCQADVDILRRCCLQFRQEIMRECNIDPFQHCITIASCCNRIFRKHFLQEKTIAIIPHHGYKPRAKQSTMGYEWMAYVASRDKIYIQHGRNEGERRVGPYFLDGYDETTKTVYEFQGCFWHGCLNCYPANTVNPVNQLTMQELHEKTEEKRKYLEDRGMQVICMWECEWNALKKNNPDVASFVTTFDLTTPLEPRDAFYGGRTNATKLFVEAGNGLKMKYVDFTSLYPDINKNGIYPMGHPMIITENISPDISDYFGLIKCDVIPPRGLYNPVLPCKINKKLMFALCRTCAETCQQSPCEHNDLQRTLRGTWVSLEVEKAVSLGYKVSKIHEVWHFPKQSNTLFSGYVNTFLKKKQEASGWPSWVQTEMDKEKYLEDYFIHEKIKLDHASIERNEGKRTVYKNILNNFWGKFGQRPNRPKVSVISDPNDYFQMLTSGGLKVTNAQLVNEEIIELFYEMEDQFIETSARTNVVLAAFTTAQARLKLYSVLEQLDQRVCYFDTDSIIYLVKEGEWEPPLGDHLGELTNELDQGDHIVTFVSAGPKNYAFRTASGKTTCKVKGITLSFRASEKVNFDSMLELVKSNDGTVINVKTPYTIVRNKMTKDIVTEPQDKDYRMVYDKRVIKNNLDTLPYGY